MPTAVLMMIGQTEVTKITKIADGLESRLAALFPEHARP